MAADLAWSTGAGKRVSTAVPIEENEAENLFNQVRAQARDKDKLRLLSNCVLSYSIPCTLAARFVSTLEFTEARVDACVLFWDAVSDQGSFEEACASPAPVQQQECVPMVSVTVGCAF